MASIYKRKRSPYFWIKYTDPANGKIERKSTEIRHDAKNARSQVRMFKLQAEMLENEPTGKKSEHFESWVVGFLTEQYRSREQTLKRYLGCWSWLDEYLQELEIRVPRHFQYQHAADYVRWRTNYKKRGKGTVGKNTALIDLKVMRIVMRHAVRMGFCEFNPCERLGISRDPSPEKPEMTDDEIAIIRRELQTQEPWMSRSFEIALNTGCRISETQIALKSIDLARKTIFFAKPKGGAKRAFSAPLPIALMPLMQELKNAGEEITLTLPQMSGKIWWKFFKKIGLDHLCFHCTRVTFVTRGCRANIPEAIMRKMVNHGDEIVHRVYQRLRVEDVEAYANKIPLPSLAASLSIPVPLPG